MALVKINSCEGFIVFLSQCFVQNFLVKTLCFSLDFFQSVLHLRFLKIDIIPLNNFTRWVPEATIVALRYGCKKVNHNINSTSFFQINLDMRIADKIPYVLMFRLPNLLIKTHGLKL